MGLEVSVHKSLGSFTLDAEFKTDGGTLALLGASGSGKSLTLKCIAGIVTPDNGRIVLDGKVLFDSELNINLPPQKRKVGYLFQNYALFPNMTAIENIAAAIRGGKSQKLQIASEKIKQLYLDGLEDKYPRQLSGGQQQRVALARILASSPDVILLDEPFSALDSYLKWQLETQLIDTLSAFKGPAVYVSHNRDEVFRICDNVCVMSGGGSEDICTVERLFNSPSTKAAALLSGCKNFSDIRKAGEYTVFAQCWGTALKTSLPVTDEVRYIGVRAHYIKPYTPVKDGHNADSDVNVIECRVKRITEELFSMVITLCPVSCANTADIRMEIPKENWTSLYHADILNICISPDDILLLK